MLLILLLSVASFNAIAQTLHVDDEVSHWEADILGGLNNDGWQFDFGVAYFPLQYIGVKANIGFAGEIEQIEDWGKDELETGHSYASRFKFNPSLVMPHPQAYKLEITKCRHIPFCRTGHYPVARCQR